MTTIESKFHSTLDRILYSRDLVLSDLEAKRIFHANETKIEKLSLCSKSKKITTECLSSLGELEDCLSRIGEESLSFFFLRQRDSWNRIQLSHQAFVTLIQALNVFHPFWSFVQGFGLKFEPIDENFIDIKSRFDHDVDTGNRSHELCYSIRYFERNNRPNTRAIWSERQVALYHRLDILNLRSTWIIIQPSEMMTNQLKALLTSVKENELDWIDHLNLHLLFFMELGASWRSYISFLEAQLMELDEKAFYSSVGTIRKSDYTITFNDAQDLELIGRKMMKASLILKSNADIGRSWNVKLGNLGQRLGQERFSGSQEAMQEYITELERHARVVDSLLDRLAGTSKLLYHILEYRNDEKTIQTNAAIQDNGQQLKMLTEHAVTESNFMTTMTREIREDSKFIKVLTFIALLYSPASLIGTIFSSNLVQIKKSTAIDEPTHLTLVSDFWKYPVVTFCLIVMTLISAFTWRKYWPICRERIIGSLSRTRTRTW